MIHRPLILWVKIPSMIGVGQAVLLRDQADIRPRIAATFADVRLKIMPAKKVRRVAVKPRPHGVHCPVIELAPVRAAILPVERQLMRLWAVWPPDGSG